MTRAFLSEQIKITKVKDAQTTGATGDVASDSVDMAENGGWDGVVFLTSYGTAAADNKIHVESSSDDGSSDAFADLAGSEIDGGASDEDQFVDILNPPERYVRCVAERGTSTTLGDIWALRYRGSEPPIDNVTSGTQEGKQLIGPAEGTK